MCRVLLSILFWPLSTNREPDPSDKTGALGCQLYTPIPQRAAPSTVHLLLVIHLKALTVTLTLTDTGGPS